MTQQHITEAIVVGCMDFRFQPAIEDWLHSHLGKLAYDRVSLVGGVFDFYAVLKQVEIASRLHGIKKVILLNHEDCGAYGKEGTKERHIYDLMEARRKIALLYPHLQVQTFYIHLDKSFEEIMAESARE